MTEAFEIIKKHGVLGVLCVWLFFMNSRLSTVEAKLYDCYDDKIVMQHQANNSIIHLPERIIAILPDDKNNKRYTRTEGNV
jgi:hypothetical protein